MTGFGRWMLVCTLLVGCSPDRVELLLDLDTDLVPGVEVSLVRTERFDHLPRTEERAAPEHTRELAAERGDAWDTPFRIAELSGLEPGRHYIRVRLLTQSDVPVLQRLAVLTVRETSIFTITMTRDCRGVVCPASGDDPATIACIGGECADPRCTPETPEHCPAPACTADGDCMAAGACATARCSSGACLAVPEDASCESWEWCSPDDGCVRETRVIATSEGGEVLPYDVVVTPSGDAAVVGAISGSVDLGGGAIPAPPSLGWMIAQYGPDLAMRWGHVYGASSVTDGRSIALGPDGGTLSAGIVRGTGTFGTTAVTAGSSQDVLVLAHGDGGSLGLVHTYATMVENAQGRGIATRSDGAIALAGVYGTDLTMGGIALPDVPAGATDWGFAAVVDPLTAATWAVHFPGSVSVLADDAVFLDGGAVCVVGRFDADLSAAGATVASAGGWDGFVARVDAGGSVAWARTFGGPGNDTPAVAVAAGDDCIVVGRIDEGAAFDDVVADTRGGADGFVARYDAAGTVAWVRVIGGTGTDFLWGASPGPGATAAIVGGTFSDTIALGGETLAAAGRDAIVVGIAADGAIAWARSFGGDGDETVAAVGYDATRSQVVIATRFTGTTRVGRLEATAASSGDAWLHWFTP